MKGWDRFDIPFLILCAAPFLLSSVAVYIAWTAIIGNGLIIGAVIQVIAIGLFVWLAVQARGALNR